VEPPTTEPRAWPGPHRSTRVMAGPLHTSSVRSAIASHGRSRTSATHRRRPGQRFALASKTSDDRRSSRMRARTTLNPIRADQPDIALQHRPHDRWAHGPSAPLDHNLVLTRPCMGTLLSRLIAGLRSPYCQLYSNDPRGARFWARCAPQPCNRLGPRGTWTMKQSFASAARLRGGGPILGTALGPWLCSGHRHLGS
jgi:hypothetical protein